MPIERRPQHPVPRNANPNSGTTHRVQDGDSWETLAKRYGLSADEIIYANFKTLVPEEINWYLRNYVGCTMATPDGNNWMFGSYAQPGSILIPPYTFPPRAVTGSLPPLYYEVTKSPSKGTPPAVVSGVRWNRSSLTIGGVLIQGRQQWTWFNPDWDAGLIYYNTAAYPLVDTLQRIVVHHTDNDQGPQANEWYEWTKGFAAIGYHFFIDRTGTIYECRPLEVMGSHAGRGKASGPLNDPDWGSVGIVLRGDYHHADDKNKNKSAKVTQLQLQSLERLVVALRHTYQIQRLVMHKEVKPTECPGDHMISHVQNLRQTLGIPGP